MTSIFKKKFNLEKEKERLDIINTLVDDFKRTKPTDEQLTEYKRDLSMLKLKALKTLLQPYKIKGKLKILDRLFFILSKKKRLLVTFYNTNGTVSHYCIHKKGRTFKIDGNTYVTKTDQARLNTTYKIMSLVYLEGIPLPINFHQVKDGLTASIDAKALTNVIKMEYVEMLSRVGKVKDALNIILILSGVAALASVVTVVIQSGVVS